MKKIFFRLRFLMTILLLLTMLSYICVNIFLSKKNYLLITNEFKGILLDFIYYCENITSWMFCDLWSSDEQILIINPLMSDFLRSFKNREQLALTLLKESERENARLKAILHFLPHNDDFRAIGAFVINEFGISPANQTIQINLGSMIGIQKGNGVISHAGAVGRVRSIGNYSSEILLLSDELCSINALVQRSKMRGTMNRFKFYSFDKINRNANIKIGDIIITSKFNSGFPEGIPIGTVVNFKKNSQCACYEADIKPFVDFDRLDEVIVLKNNKDNRILGRNNLIIEIF